MSKRSINPNPNGRLPNELVVEILSWLPIKPLMRLRCVSKTWLRTLSIDPHFINLHLQHFIKHQNPNPSILVLTRPDQFISESENLEKTQLYLVEDCDNAIKLELPFDATKVYTVVGGICKGLLCLISKETDVEPEVYIWNPLTNHYIIIPCPPTRVKSPDYGFGFSQDTNEFKVLRICSDTGCVSIYTLGTSSWRTLENTSYIISLGFSFASIINGSLHWFIPNPYWLSRYTLISFDFKDEAFQEIPTPNDILYDPLTNGDPELLEVDGLLCIYRTIWNFDIEIWAMKEYGIGSSWVKQFTLGTSILREQYSLKPLGVANNGDIIIKKGDCDFVLYDPQTNLFKMSKKFEVRVYDAYAYKGSLVSPKLIDGGSHVVDASEENVMKEGRGLGLLLGLGRCVHALGDGICKCLKKIGTTKLIVCYEVFCKE